MLIRSATRRDLASIAAIYNAAVAETTATFDTEPRSIEAQQRWFADHDERHPVLVAEIDGAVIGWCCLTRWSPRRAYDDTAETSFYVDAPHRGCGIGRALKTEIINRARRLGYHTLIARVAEGNPVSEHLNREFGFEFVGTLREVGLKFGRRLDVAIYQKMLTDV